MSHSVVLKHYKVASTWERKRSMTLSNSATFFTHRSFDRSFYRTGFYCLLIYTHLTICAEDLILLNPLIAWLSTETAAFVSFQLLRRHRVVSGCIKTFTSASRRCHFHHHQPLHHSLSPVTAFHSLTSAFPTVACHSCVYFAFLSPLSAS